LKRSPFRTAFIDETAKSGLKPGKPIKPSAGEGAKES
jgi:hypothetical protein